MLSTPTVAENLSPPVLLSTNTVHPTPYLQPRPDDQMDVDAPPPVGVKAEDPPTPPPPPPGHPNPQREVAPPPPPGEPPAKRDDNYFEKHALL